MDVHNIATVITPNILYSNSKQIGMDDSLLAIEAVNCLIEFNETMCEVWYSHLLDLSLCPITYAFYPHSRSQKISNPS